MLKSQKMKQKTLKKQSQNKQSNIQSLPKTEDKRFQKMQYDPKFITPSSKVQKIKINPKFQKMLTDPRFSIGGTKDRYGRSTEKKQVNQQLLDYYYLDKQKNQNIDEENQLHYEQSDQASLQQDGLRKWMQQYNQESSDDIDINYFDQQAQNQNDIWSQQQQGVIKNDQVLVTKRLALCNYDWMNINSKDLMILFNSFKPKQGYIKSVKIYQSDFGKQKMEEEELHGPKKLWEGEENQNNIKKKQKKKNKYNLIDDDEDEHQQDNFDSSKLRAYQKERLKYYYAIIECDNKKTTQQIYETCDGEQFQNSNLTIDLRFVPDQTQFNSQMLKQQSTELPCSGEVKDMVSRATGHSKVLLTWEDPSLSITSNLKKKNWNKMNDQEIDKIDWATYMNDQDIVDEDNLRLILPKDNKQTILDDWRQDFNKKKSKQKKDDIEITFATGFDKAPTNNNFQSLNSQQKQKKSLKQKRRQKQQKQKQQLQLLVDKNVTQQFEANVDDNRFKEVYDNSLFFIDPVDPRFDHRKIGKIFQNKVKKNKIKNLQ